MQYFSARTGNNNATRPLPDSNATQIVPKITCTAYSKPPAPHYNLYTLSSYLPQETNLHAYLYMKIDRSTRRDAGVLIMLLLIILGVWRKEAMDGSGKVR